jgi:H+/Cl- antiporter ClcA
VCAVRLTRLMVQVLGHVRNFTVFILSVPPNVSMTEQLPAFLLLGVLMGFTGAIYTRTKVG